VLAAVYHAVVRPHVGRVHRRIDRTQELVARVGRELSRRKGLRDEALEAVRREAAAASTDVLSLRRAASADRAEHERQMQKVWGEVRRLERELLKLASASFESDIPAVPAADTDTPK
jgi:predicted translin family RNA/ssDNA-binding protein